MVKVQNFNPLSHYNYQIIIIIIIIIIYQKIVR